MRFIHIPKTAGTSIEMALGLDQCHRRASETPRPRFAFVRHPLDRLVSMWEFARQSASEKTRAYLCGAATMLEMIERTPDNTLTRPQSWWLDDEVEFIGRFERLPEDFARISDKPLTRERQSARGPWRDYFDARLLTAAVARYRVDFDRFGYVAAI